MAPVTSIQLRIGASFGVALLVIAIGWIGAGALSAALVMQAKATHTRAVADAGRQVLQALLDEESAARGYLLSRNDEFLAAYQRARSGQPLVTPLRTLLVGDMEALRRVDTLEQDVAERERELAYAVSLPPELALGRLREGSGQRAMERIRFQLDELVRDEEQMRDRIIARQRRTLSYTRAVIFGGTLVVFSLAVLVNVSLIRAVRDRDAGVHIVEEQATRLQDQTVRLLQHEQDLGEQLVKQQQLSAALQRSNEALDQFAYATSHDLRAPLRGIMNLASWVEDDLGNAASEDVRQNLAMLRNRARRLELLIEGILAYARAGRAHAKPERVDTRALLVEVTELIDPPAGVTVEPTGAWPTLTTERVPLQQVLMNLTQNAIKHGCPDGEGRVELGAASLPAGGYRFRVTDHGAGVAPEFHQRIFGIFQVLAPRDRVEGTGIGLAVVKKIVEARGGEVGIESERGKGATFWFTWPETAA
jgi:signal transduction histidine kinase